MAHEREHTWIERLIAAAIVLVVLIVGRPLLVPFALALVLWAVLNALAEALQRIGLPSFIAWGGAILIAAGAAFMFGRILAVEGAVLSQNIPAVADRLEAVIARWLAFVQIDFHLADLLQRPEFAQAISRVAGSLTGSLIIFLQIVIYVAFLLVEQRHWPEKMSRIFADDGHEERARSLARAIMHQVQAFLGVNTLTSTIMAGLCYGLMRIFDIHFAGLLALILFVLSYIPLVGMASVVLPPLIALAQIGEIGAPAIILGVLGGVRFLLKEVMETLLLGRTLNLSPLAIILSLAFWELIWGPAGLFLAVPLTAAIVIVCDHIASLRWISIVLGAPKWASPRQDGAAGATPSRTER